ncbi:hypothetical protein KKE06_00960 [Candidatus Micrarchaeota archaeon]|nr:hypothetical protein [Candidatus Micrarchaeota archaeon]MBU1929874.1 hypothetical protein [Candidatus Micrarchaeota archaeon]
MRIAIVFFSRAGKTAELADTISLALGPQKAELIQINVLKQKEKKKSFGLANKHKLKLISTQTDLSKFDLIFFGSEVEGMSPKRKLPEEIIVYLQECTGIEGKSTAVFLNCFGIPGTSLQKIQSILQTRNAKIINNKIFTYLLGLTKKQLEEAKEFAQKTREKIR